MWLCILNSIFMPCSVVEMFLKHVLYFRLSAVGARRTSCGSVSQMR